MRTSARDFRTPVLCLATLAGGLILHEAGHAVAASLTGGQVVKIALLSELPNVEVRGVATHALEAVRAASGSASVILVAFFLLLVCGWQSIYARLLALFSLAELTGWVTSALSANPSPNDATDFIRSSGFSGGAVAGTCLVIAAAAAMVIAIRREPVFARTVR